MELRNVTIEDEAWHRWVQGHRQNKRVRQGKNRVFKFHAVKTDKEPRMSAAKSVFSKKARVSINGGLSKIGGHLF